MQIRVIPRLGNPSGSLSELAILKLDRAPACLRREFSSHSLSASFCALPSQRSEAGHVTWGTRGKSGKAGDIPEFVIEENRDLEHEAK